MRSFIRWAVACAILALTYAAPLHAQGAQPQKFLTMVDTAGIAEAQPHTDVYVTWIYAMSTPTSWPAAGIFVAFDCANHKVARIAHVVYQLKPDSSGVVGPIEQDSGGWQEVSVPATFDLVCRIGRRNTAAINRDESTQPTQPTPEPSGKPWAIS